MNTLTSRGVADSLSLDNGALAWRVKQQWRLRGRRYAPMAAIVAAHALLFVAINSGLMSKVAQVVMPRVVTVTFVAAPEALKPVEPPKTVPLVQPPPRYVPPMPLVNIQQTEPTITVAPPSPKVSEPATVASNAPVSAAAPAPPAAAPAAPKTITGVEYIRAPQPVYPNIARRLGESGTVMLRVLIGEKGQAEQVLIQKSSGSANLDEAGRQAALRALFKPYLEDGKPVPVYALVPINFQLG